MDHFRPRLPIDPFNDNVPWTIHSIWSQHKSSQVILVLGDPPTHDIHALIHANSLSSSLILIATHTPPVIALPLSPPHIRILRLSAPLAVQDSGAIRLVSLFDRAGRAARLWRTQNQQHSERILQFAEDGPGGEFSLQEPYNPTPNIPSLRPSPLREFSTQSTQSYPSPAPSLSSRSSLSLFRIASNSISPQTSAASSTASINSRRAKKQKPKPASLPQGTDRSFDAIINYLPQNVQEHALLKHAVLVTTLSAPYLATPPPSITRKYHINNNIKSHSLTTSAHINPISKQSKRNSVFSSFSFSSSNASIWPARPSVNSACNSDDSLPLASFPLKSHIIHVLPHRPNGLSSSASSLSGPSRSTSNRLSRLSVPSNKPKLVQSIEQFLLSFAYPLTGMTSPSLATGSHRASVSMHGHEAFGMTTIKGSHIEKPVPYLVGPGVLRDFVAGTDKKLAVCEALLTGALDPSDEQTGAGRAWIASASDVVMEGTPTTPEAVLVSSASATVLNQIMKQAPSSWNGDEFGLGVQQSRSSESERTVREGKLKKRQSGDGIRSTKGKLKDVPTGLPTPPESSGSSEGGDDDSEEGTDIGNSPSTDVYVTPNTSPIASPRRSIPKGAKVGEGVYEPSLNMQLVLDVHPGSVDTVKEGVKDKRRVVSMFGGKEKGKGKGVHYIPARLQSQSHVSLGDEKVGKKRWWTW